MRIACYSRGDGAVGFGLVEGNEIRPLGRPGELEADAVLAADTAEIARWAEESDERVPLDGVRLLSPVPRPRRVLALAGSFPPGGRDGLPPSADPWFFSKWPDDVKGPDDDVAQPAFADVVVPEIELAAVVGRSGRDLDPEAALRSITHVTIANDFSARSLRAAPDRRPGKFSAFFDWLTGKWFDGFLSLGPWLVPRGSLDVSDLTMTTRVNGRVIVSGSTSAMAFGVGETVSYLSRFMSLQPGDVVCLGAIPVDGPESPLVPGDVIEGEIAGIGILRNTFQSTPVPAGEVGR